MFETEDEARNALRTVTDEPAPPVTTSLGQVVRRGRRRILAQRAGAVAGVMAVVTAIGAGAVLLRGPDGGGVQVASSQPPAPSSATGSAPLPGWEKVVVLGRTGDECPQLAQLPPPDDVRLLPQTMVEAAFVDAVRGVLGQEPVVVLSEWTPHSPQIGARGHVVLKVGTDEIRTQDGTGTLQLEAGVHGGTPIEAADVDVHAYGNCEPVYRHVQDDGTVLQLHPDQTGRLQPPVQSLRIYLPNGRQYVVTAYGGSSVELARIALRLMASLF